MVQSEPSQDALVTPSSGPGGEVVGTRDRHVCPHCAGTLQRSRTRSFWERFARLILGYKKYRCEACGEKVWRPPGGEAPRKPRRPTKIEAPTSRKKDDRIALRVQRRSRNRVLLTIVIVVISGLVVGMVIAHKSQPAGGTIEGSE